MAETISDDDARAMRVLWFSYLDSVEPVRPKLHAYCLRLTGSIFDAEDLVQEALLRGFGAIGRGDLTGGTSAFRNAGAYLSRTATNLWVDSLRRRGRAMGADDTAEPSATPGVITPAAGAALFERTAPQERAAVVLKDVFDFSLEEIADILCTTSGAVKSALHRGRGKLKAAREAPLPIRANAASVELVDRFVAAFNARDLAAVKALLTDTAVYEARGVGGERGKNTTWLTVNIDRPQTVGWERHIVDGEPVAVGVYTGGRRKLLTGASRLDETAGLISRHVGYFFCPETLEQLGERLGMRAANHGYHQDQETLARMVAGSSLPWRAV